MNERSDDEHIRPEGPEPEPAAPGEGAPSGADEDTRADKPAEPAAADRAGLDEDRSADAATDRAAANEGTRTEPAPEPTAVDRAALDEGTRTGAATDRAAAAGDPRTEGDPEPAAPPARRGIAGVLSALALLVALGAAAAVGYFAWMGRGEGDAAAANREAVDAVAADLDRVQSTLDDLAGRIDELDSTNGDQADRLDALSQDLSDLSRELSGVTERLESIPARIASLESAVSSLAGISTGAREAWLLSEAEHYMQIANAQLQLAGNPERALLALRFADERIRQVADPGLTEVRRALADELRALQAMEVPDLAGVTMTLASLAGNVESLPLQQDVRQEETEDAPPEGDASGLDRAIASVKSAFSGIVSVRRSDESVEPLLSPEAEYFLRANLALRLQTARLALLRGEQAVLEQTLRDAAEWLREYYAVDSRAVQSALETLAEIREADWSVSAPDISRSLELLRQYRERRRAAAPGPEPAQ